MSFPAKPAPARGLFAALLASFSLAAAAPPPAHVPSSCGKPGDWLKPAAASAELYPAEPLLRRLVGQQVVLLGETHDRADDHRWQLDMLTALQRQRPNIAIGFEMFPRRLQPVLDRWVAGQLTEAQFLEQAEWKKVWGYDAELYWPLFRFAREHRLPMLALNVDRDLVRRVGVRGWDGVPESERGGVGRPAAPSDAYRASLKAVYDSHAEQQDESGRFDHFVDAQALWDRAMAEVIAGHLKRRPQDLVVGILGAGHVQFGHGVPHQLAALGVMRQTGLMTWPSDQACAGLVAGLADAVFVIPPQHKPQMPKPRLGVRLDMAEGAVRIDGVMAGSLAEQNGLKAGDLIVQAGGSPPADVQALIRLVQRHPAGSGLPLQIRRGTELLDVVVQFPAEP